MYRPRFSLVFLLVISMSSMGNDVPDAGKEILRRLGGWIPVSFSVWPSQEDTGNSRILIFKLTSKNRKAIYSLCFPAIPSKPGAYESCRIRFSESPGYEQPGDLISDDADQKKIIAYFAGLMKMSPAYDDLSRQINAARENEVQAIEEKLYKQQFEFSSDEIHSDFQKEGIRKGHDYAHLVFSPGIITLAKLPFTN